MGAADRIADTLLRIGQIQGDSLSRTGDIQARAMELAAQARAGGVTGSADAIARATAANGQIWGQTLAQLGQLPGQVMQQQRQGKIADQEMAMRKLQLDQATHAAAGEKALASNLAGDQLAPGATGPRQESYLGADGLFDVPKITQALASGGYGDIAPSLVKGAESINDSITKHQAAVRLATTAQTVLLGDMADGVSKMVKSGTPIDRALDFVAAPALASKSIDPQRYQQVRAQLLQLPPEQQQAALANLMDQGSKAAGGGETLSKGAVHVDRYGRTAASNAEPVDPNKGDYTINDQRFHANGAPIGTAVPKQTTPAEVETARHNRELERIAQLTAGRTSAAAAETARHNRATELAANPFGSVNFGGTPAGESPSGAQTGAVGPTGDDFLKTLTPAQAAQVKALAEGRQPFPTGMAMSKLQPLIQAVTQYDPSFDASNYTARSKARADMQSPNGTAGKTINSLNTAIQHAGKLSDLIEALDNGDTPAANAVKNWWNRQMGGTKATNFDAVQPQVMKEIERLWRGSGGSQGDIDALKSSLGTNMGRQQQREALAEFVGLMEGKLSSTEQQRDAVMGAAGKTIPVLFPTSVPIVEQIKKRAGGGSGGGGGVVNWVRDPSGQLVPAK